MKRRLVSAAGVIALLWLTGLIVFVWRIEAMSEPPIGPALETTDAIVVLTGGSERMATGLALLKAGVGKKLFVSGVHPGLTLDRFLADQQVPKELRACCIFLGHEAESTMGNADETLAWMTVEGGHSLRLVTANYHMPRSLMIFHAAMPEIKIIPHPVAPESVKLDDWWGRPRTASLLVTEYNKYLWAVVRLWVGG